LAVGAAWLLLAMAGNSGAATGDRVYVSTVPAPGLALDGRQVGNVYPYDRRGRLLQDVRLYDETGAPLDVRPGEGRPRRVVADRTGADRYFNAFPIRYFERGTSRVRRPRAGALSESPPGIATPPVRTTR
jgi:hypothetical protein